MSEEQNHTSDSSVEKQVEQEAVDQAANDDATQADQDNSAVLTARVAELEKALAKAEQTVDDQKDSVIRGKAEVDNMRRRAAQDVEKARKFALEKFASELLPVIDNLERAIEFSDKENEAVKPVVEGVELTHSTFLSAIAKFGMEVIDPQGETFNPERHQAMTMQESTEHKPNTVIAVMQKGYVLNGRLVRPAMVMVSKAPSESIDTTA